MSTYTHMNYVKKRLESYLLQSEIVFDYYTLISNQCSENEINGYKEKVNIEKNNISMLKNACENIPHLEDNSLNKDILLTYLTNITNEIK